MQKASIHEGQRVRGFVHWQLIDDATGHIVAQGEGFADTFLERLYYALPRWLRWLFPTKLLGSPNAILNTARERLANWVVGDTVTIPQYIGIATGTGSIGAADTALDTPVDYDGANEAKQAASLSVKSNFISRIVTNFLTTEANQTIGQLGLFDAANSGLLWAKVKVSITKTSTQRLNIYWYIIFERLSTLAIKTGASVGATGSITANTSSTLTFSNPVTVVMLHNNSGVGAYFKLNGALTGSPPTDYDFFLADGESKEYVAEEFEVSTVHVYMNDTLTMPTNELTVRGW